MKQPRLMRVAKNDEVTQAVTELYDAMGGYQNYEKWLTVSCEGVELDVYVEHCYLNKEYICYFAGYTSFDDMPLVHLTFWTPCGPNVRTKPMTPEQATGVYSGTNNDITPYLSKHNSTMLHRRLSVMNDLIQDGWTYTHSKGDCKFEKNNAFVLTVNGTEVQFDGASLTTRTMDEINTVFNKDGKEFKCPLSFEQLADITANENLQLNENVFSRLTCIDDITQLLLNNHWEQDENNENVWVVDDLYLPIYIGELSGLLGGDPDREWVYDYGEQEADLSVKLTIKDDDTAQVECWYDGKTYTGKLEDRYSIELLISGELDVSEISDDLYDAAVDYITSNWDDEDYGPDPDAAYEDYRDRQMESGW